MLRRVKLALFPPMVKLSCGFEAVDRQVVLPD